MSEDLIHQITLDCLVNKDVYIKMQHKPIINKVSKKDKKFYRKRILNLTRELLLKKETEYNEINPDIKNGFDVFVKTCIQYFKVIDKNDIIQEDYTIFDEEEIDIKKDILGTGTNVIYNNENDNKLFMRTIKSKPNLDKFVKIKSIKKEDEFILPKIREIHLDDPLLRNKGIQKKENINIIQDDDKKKESNQT
jgi:hypothetical protein